MDLSGKHVIVVGLGRSGVAAARLCLARGACVLACDRERREALSPAALALTAQGAELVAGGHDELDLAAADLVVVSPGVADFPALRAAERAGREVIGELELASRFLSAPLALVGGTNGKSTTTALLGEMLRLDGRRTFVGGNFGTPLAEAVGGGFEVHVVEISSFQAERVSTLHARAAALLNITPDHLDRYPSFEAYAHAKGNPFARMDRDDVAVIPAGDALCARQAARGAARVFTFGAGGDVRCEGERLVDGPSGESFPLASVRLRGAHNLGNACAALAVALRLGARPSAVHEALASFRGLAHRTELVATVRGVPYYDDSKGTNVAAAVAALRGLPEPRAVLIAGGRDKLGGYRPLVEALGERGRALVVLGEAAERIAAEAAEAVPVRRARTMDEAVAAAASLARPGDAVLLSPACSSFDMFRDYRERGEAFARAARALAAAEVLS